MFFYARTKMSPNVGGDAVKQYLLDFQERGLPKGVERELKVPLDTNYVVSIVGPRRAGKTFYFYQLIGKLPREEVMFIDFEHPLLEGFEPKDIVELLKLQREVAGEPSYVFLDEVQEVRGWEKFVRYLQDEGYHVFVTGSSSKLLSREISTQMRGRALKFTLLPFSFREFLKARGFEPKKRLSSRREAEVKAHLMEYLRWGGFPQVVFEGEEALKEALLMEYLDMVVYKDVVERYGVMNTHLVKLLIRSIMRSFAKEFSVNSLFNTLKSQGIKVSKASLYEYLDHLEDAMAVFLLKKFSYSLRTSELSVPKAYPVDMGLPRLFSFSPDIGRLMENTVFLELLRRGREAYYYKEHREVDFVVLERGSPVELIQVTYAGDWEDIRPRELDALIAVGKKLNVENLRVVTWDYEKEGEVKFVPLWKWLIEWVES